jgi:hypothetical protein
VQAPTGPATPHATPEDVVRFVTEAGNEVRIDVVDLANILSEVVAIIDPSARAVLKHHFEGVRVHDDVRSYRGFPADAELIAAGVPCQDLSQAGRTLGVAFDPDRLRDHSTFADPKRYSTGFDLIVVNGTPVVEDDVDTGTTAGRFLLSGSQAGDR